jgi:Zn-dependent peptidase ImmA (M78 family)
VYLCEQRQDWYREHARETGEPRVDFVGSAQPSDDVATVAEQMRTALGFGAAVRRKFSTWTDAFRGLIELAEAAGVLVMVSGVVGNNTHRKLNYREFRGFALADEFAPLVFINGTDTKAAQSFTLAHELAHLWIGSSGVSAVGPDDRPGQDPERWCNAVAGELLVPLTELRNEYDDEAPLTAELQRLVKIWKVSTLVVLSRLYDVRALSWDAYREAYDAELALALRRAEERRQDSSGGGGDFYNTKGVRVGRRFARAIVASALEGSTTYREALQLLAFHQHSTLVEWSRRLGVA